jgi:hypothetical protein
MGRPASHAHEGNGKLLRIKIRRRLFAAERANDLDDTPAKIELHRHLAALEALEREYGATTPFEREAASKPPR